MSVAAEEPRLLSTPGNYWLLKLYAESAFDKLLAAHIIMLMLDKLVMLRPVIVTRLAHYNEKVYFTGFFSQLLL